MPEKHLGRIDFNEGHLVNYKDLTPSFLSLKNLSPAHFFNWQFPNFRFCRFQSDNHDQKSLDKIFCEYYWHIVY